MLRPDIDTLPVEAAQLARSLAAGELLGATRNVVEIGRTLATVVANDPSREVLDRVVGYFQSTRGSETRAVANGLDLLTADLPVDGMAPSLERRANWFADAAGQWNRTIAETAGDLFGSDVTVVAFDYSSVVAAVLRHGHDHRGWRIVVPESRALEGGRPFIDQLGAGAIARVVPDVAIARAVRDADAALIGAETCFADGSCHNTVGSLTVALCAAQLDVPFHVATPLLKFAGADVVAPECSGRRDFAERFGPVPGADTEQPENERVPPGLITSYVTERGVVPPDGLGSAALAGLESIRVGLAHA